MILIGSPFSCSMCNLGMDLEARSNKKQVDLKGEHFLPPSLQREGSCCCLVPRYAPSFAFFCF